MSKINGMDGVCLEGPAEHRGVVYIYEVQAAKVLSEGQAYRV